MGNLRNLATKVQNNNDTQDLKSLAGRLQHYGFSWQHEDYFLLKRLLPRLIADQEVDFPILKIIDSYLQAGGRIEKRHGRICTEYMMCGDDYDFEDRSFGGGDGRRVK